MFKGISKIVQRISTFSTIQQVCFKFDMVFPSPEELGLKKNSNFKKSAPLWNSKIVSFFRNYDYNYCQNSTNFSQNAYNYF